MQVQRQALHTAFGRAFASGTPVQRQGGIPAGTHVVVNDGGPAWYGQVISVDDTAGTYAVRVGGTDEPPVHVPQAQVDYHATVAAVAPVRVAMERWVDGLPAINLPGDMAAFGGTSALAALVVAAQGQMADGADVAEHTLAMFEYMDRHAAAIGGRILADFLLLDIGQAAKRRAYLESMSGCMTRKIQKGLWIGDDDKGMIAVDALDPVGYFSQGKVNLLAKAGQAQAANKTLESLLENLSLNLEPKSYGRRQESAAAVDINSLVTAGLAAPQAGVPVAHNQAGYVYWQEDYSGQVAANALVPGTSYALSFNGTQNLTVTIATNTATHVTFSHVA